MKVRLMQIAALICALLCAPASALTQTPVSGTLEGALAIENPAERLAALQKFLKTNSIPEQNQTAREAIVNIHAQLGETQLGENNIERAMEEFRRALANLPEKITDRFFEETVVRIPLAVSVRGYRSEATALARQLEKRFAKEPARLARLGEFYLTIEAPNDAIRTLETASKLAEEDATLHRALGAAYRMGLRLDEAVAEYQQAVNFDAKDKRAYYELANLYRAHGAYADAAKLYQKQIEIEPKHTPSHKGLALAYTALGKPDDAAAALNQARDIRGAIEEVTGDIYLQTQLAFHYLSRNKLKEARQAADAALYVEPRYAWARIAAAEIDMAEGKYFDAERHLLAAKNYAGFPTLFFTLGKLYLAVEDFDGAQEQFAKAFTYTPQKQFSTRLGGSLDVQAENLKELLSREHQASIFLAEPPTSDEQFKVAESLVKFNTRLRMLKMATPINRPTRGQTKPAQPAQPESGSSNQEARRKQMEELDQAAMGFVEAENVRRSFRMLYIAGQLANAGVATGLAIELAEQALGLAEVATEFEGSLREYPNYDRNGRLSIFRGRALDAKGWALFKANRTDEASATLSEAVQAYGTLPENKRAIRHLATVKESVSEWKEALDLYIAGYEPSENADLDVNRAVIEVLYRKVNGSLDGLEKRIGPALIATNAATNAAKPAAKAPDPKSNRTVVKKDPVIKPSPSFRQPAEREAEKEIVDRALPVTPKAEQPPRIVPAASSVPVTEAEQPVENPTVSTPFTRPAPIIRKSTEPAPIIRNSIEKPVELPAIPAPFTIAPLIDPGVLYSALEMFSSHSSLETGGDVPPPPPTPQVHTRKRRVTVPDNQPPSN